MHPILYSEIKQIQREYKSILFFVFIIVAARFALGDYGHLINIFFFFPIIAGAIGTGLLSQEYSKDYLKYLFSLPIKRWHFIFVKIMFSIIVSAIFFLIIYIIKWVVPPRIVLPKFVFPFFFNLTSLLLFSLIISLFNYSICTFSVTFLRSPKMAGSVNYLSLVIAFLYLGYCFIDTGYKYKLFDYIIIFAPSSAIMTLGGFYLFTIRNPFLNRNLRHLITGILIAVLCIIYFAGSTQFICHEHSGNIFEVNKTVKDSVANKGIKFCSVSPDGKFVFVTISLDRIISHSYVFNSSGRLLADLGRSSSVGWYDILWQFNNGKRMMIYKKEKLILSEINSRKFSRFFVLDLDGQKKYPFENIDDRKNHCKYMVLNSRTLEFYGIGYGKDFGPGDNLYVFKHNILTDSINASPIPDSNKYSIYTWKLFDSEHIVDKTELSNLEKELYKYKHTDAGIKLNIFNLEEKKLVKVFLPDVTGALHYLMNNGKCYFAEKLTDENGYSYRVACAKAGNIDKIYLPQEKLPRVSYKEVAEGKTSDIYFWLSSSPKRKWIECYYNNKQGKRQLLLIDQDGNSIDANIDSKVVFSPEETRFYVHHREKQNNNSEKHIFRIYDIKDQQVVFVKDFEADDAVSNFKFLNDNEMIYTKDPTPQEKWINNKYLVRLDLETMESTPFFEN